MKLAPCFKSRYAHMTPANEPIVEELITDQSLRDLPEAVRKSLPPIVVVDEYHKLNPNDEVILVTLPKNL